MYGYLFLKHWGAKPTVCDAVDTLFTFNPKIVAVLSNSDKYRRVPGMLRKLTILCGTSVKGRKASGTCNSDFAASAFLDSRSCLRNGCPTDMPPIVCLPAACVSLTFLNAKTILGGMDLWRVSAKLGLSPPRDPHALSRYQSFAKELMATRLDSGDGKIEIFSMASTADYVQAQMVCSKIRLRCPADRVETGGCVLLAR